MNSDYQQFYNTVMEYYGEYGRHDLPWRKKQTAYSVLVSEIMLQQTQVDRVIPFFMNWMKLFPDLQELADAPQTEVLKQWKGLGYNSRALRLQKCAQKLVKDHKGKIPRSYEKLLALPGLGPYTAAAVMNFAYNVWTPLIETNIRRIYIHHFFNNERAVSDKDILEKVTKVGCYESPKIWCAALMDYGSTLPKIIQHNPNIKSKHYTKQSKFNGSDREIRGKILDILLQAKNHKISEIILFKKLNTVIGSDNEVISKDQTERYQKILVDLKKEGFLKKQKKSIILR